jgi:hypothetical protein
MVDIPQYIKRPEATKSGPAEKQETTGDSQKPIDKKLAVLKANLTKIQAELSEEKAQKKDKESVRDSIFGINPLPFSALMKSKPETKTNTPYAPTEDRLELAEKEYMAALKEKHETEMNEII